MKKKSRIGVELTIASAGVLLAAIALDHNSVGVGIARAGGFMQAYDLAITKTDSPDPVIAGNNLTYSIVVTNTGAPTSWIDVTDALPPGTTFQSLVAPAGFTCTTPAVGQPGSILCQLPSGMGSPSDTRTLSLVVTVDAATPKNTLITNTAAVKPTVCTPPCDMDPSNDMFTAQTTVDTQADLSLTKTATPDPVPAGSLLDYTLTVTNNGPSAAQDVMISDTTPPNTTFFNAQPSSGGSCVTPPPNGAGAIKCTYPGATLPSESHSVAITVRTCAADVGTCGGQVVNTGQATSSTFDPDSNNSTATVSTPVLPVPAPVLSGIGLVVEVLLLLAVGGWALARLRVARR
jgi:uncharacterized repeat protein (TIGR01451 family)